MRVIALINGQKAVVLIDTGSTHNFMDKGLVASLKLQVDHTSCFEVKVSNGQITKTMGECKSMKFKIQDLQFKVNFSLLELGGCGIVLGTQWLSTLGVISWDFKKLLMVLCSKEDKFGCKVSRQQILLYKASRSFKMGLPRDYFFKLYLVTWLPFKSELNL